MKNIHKLLVVALASFMVVGCNNTTPNTKSNEPGQSKVNKIVEDIAIKVAPKVDYVLGETFSIEGGIIELQFEDGTTEDISFSVPDGGSSILVSVSLTAVTAEEVSSLILNTARAMDATKAATPEASFTTKVCIENITLSSRLPFFASP